MTEDAPEAEPAAAAELFGDRLEAARRYAAFLASDGIERGLLGPREVGRLWTRHLLNCAVVAELTSATDRVVDIGSGAGLPGICVALARPTLQVDLVEPLLRRAAFLDEAVERLELTNCRVFRARAEDCVREVGGADVVTARAVAPLAKLTRWAAPLLRDGGRLLAVKGSSAPEEVDRDRAAARKYGIVDLEVIAVGGASLSTPTTVVTGVRRDERSTRRSGATAAARTRRKQRRSRDDDAARRG